MGKRPPGGITRVTARPSAREAASSSSSPLACRSVPSCAVVRASSTRRRRTLRPSREDALEGATERRFELARCRSRPSPPRGAPLAGASHEEPLEGGRNAPGGATEQFERPLPAAELELPTSSVRRRTSSPGPVRATQPVTGSGSVLEPEAGGASPARTPRGPRRGRARARTPGATVAHSRNFRAAAPRISLTANGSTSRHHEAG